MARLIYKTNSGLPGIAVIFLLLLTACNYAEELLDTKSISELSSSDIFNTHERIEGLVNGTYKNLKHGDFYGSRLQLNLDIRGEEFINLTNNAYRGFDGWSNNYSASSIDVANIWGAAYTTINSANVLIDGLEKREGVISEERKRQYIAEARFIRALSYFSLVTLYGRPFIEDNGASKAIPLRLNPETSGANNDMARSTVAQVYALIPDDLDYAEAELPHEYNSGELNTTRAHKNTAIALKTRVYLNKGDFNSVIEEAVKIVAQTVAPFSAETGVRHELQDNLTEIFRSNYTSTESIFSLPMSSQDPPGTPLGAFYNVVADFSLNPAGILGDQQFGANDARGNLLRFNESTGYHFLTKFAQPFPYNDYVPVIRYSEVLLNYAEAAARTNNTELAVELLNAVHSRSDPDYIFTGEELVSGENLLSTIRKERRMELLGEGFRSNDLLRDLLPIPAKSSSNHHAQQVNPTDNTYIFPLPNSEIITNKLILD